MRKQPPTVAVLGASRGIGFGVARGYLKRGWRVIATTRTPVGKAKLRMLATEPDKLLEFNLEITDEAQIHAMVAGLSEIKIDVLFVNAGVGRGAGDRADTAKDSYRRWLFPHFYSLQVTHC